MRYLYVTGGHQRFRVFKTEREWNLYDQALILRIDTETQRAETQVAYESPAQVCASDGLPSILFKVGTLSSQELCVCTSTEVLLFELPNFRRI